VFCRVGVDKRRNLSLANEAQYLLVATASIVALQQYMAQSHSHHISQSVINNVNSVDIYVVSSSFGFNYVTNYFTI